MQMIYSGKFYFAIVLLSLSWGLAFAQTTDSTYHFFTDLTNVQKDRIVVELSPPKIQSPVVTYHLPKTVPGTYSISDFGRFVEDFEALDVKGKKLPVKSINKNGWEIQGASQLAKIRYWVNDTWDASKRDNFIFEPAGTNIEDKEIFIMNTFGFFGYFKGMENYRFEVNIKKPANFYGSTSMVATGQSTDTLDQYIMDNYHALADAPIMYNEPDTAWLEVGGADILVSVYSPNKYVSASFVAKRIEKVLEAQKSFLGGKIPVDKYAFLIYLSDHFGGSGYLGALEHSYSSLYFLVEAEDDPEVQEMLAKEIGDVAAHEFFHIITPLSIHSEEIHYFDFIEPKMSEHLWLYEGVTEYFAGLVQVQYGLMEEEEYIEILQEKIEEADAYLEGLPFTTMSKNCLEEYADQYDHVYDKGALIGLCLDVLLLEESNGKYRLIDLMKDLSKEYGKNKPFKDEELFDKITSITKSNRVGEFLNKHVGGAALLPLADRFDAIGYEFAREKEVEVVSMGNVGLGFDKDGRLIVRDISDMNDFGEKMGYAEGDVITAINGMEISSLQDALRVLKHFQVNAQKGDKLKIEVLRSEGEKQVRKKLQAKLAPTEEIAYNVLEPLDNPTEEQLKLRNIWLNKEAE